MPSKVLSSCVFLSFAGYMFSGPSALASAGYTNTYSNQSFCTELHLEMAALSPSEKNADWPLLLKSKDIGELTWTDIDPLKNMTWIELNEIKIPTYSPYVNQSNLGLVSSQAEEVWFYFIRPFYIQAIKDGQMKMQTTNSVIDGKAITLVRYGVSPSKVDGETFWGGYGTMEYYWTYFVRYTDENSGRPQQYPVTLAGNREYGEMVVVDGELSLFLAGSGSYLAQIILPSSSINGRMIFMPACPISFKN